MSKKIYKVIIHFTGGENLTLNHLEFEGDNYKEVMKSFLDYTKFGSSDFLTQNYADVSYLICRDNISYIEIL